MDRHHDFQIKRTMSRPGRVVKIHREGTKRWRHFKMNLRDYFEIETKIEESLKIEIPNDLNFSSSSKSRESGGEEMKIAETIYSRRKSGIDQHMDNNLKSTNESPRQKYKPTKGKNNLKENEIIKKKNYKLFRKKCQENAKNLVKNQRIKFDEKNEKKTMKAKCLENIRNFELFIKRFEKENKNVDAESNSTLEHENEKEKAQNCNSKKETQSIANKVDSKNDITIPEVIKQLPRLDQEKSMKKEMIFELQKKSEAPSKFDSIQKSQQIEKISSQYSEELHEFSNFVTKLEKEFEKYMQCKEEVAQMRKKFALMQNKMFMKQRFLILKKSIVDEKNENILIKLDELMKKSEGQLPHRENELLTYKLREAILRSQITLYKIIQEIPESRKMSKNSKKESPKPPTKKKFFSVAESDQLDPFIPLCPFDLNGWCNDDECKYQHILKF